MSDPVVLEAIREKLHGIAGLPTIIWPNQAANTNAPFLVFDSGAPPRVSSITIDGQEAFEIRPQVSLLVEQNTFTSAGDQILWDIAQAFKVNTKIYHNGQDVAVCLNTPVADGGRPDDGLFRRDMILRIASYQQI